MRFMREFTLDQFNVLIEISYILTKLAKRDIKELVKFCVLTVNFRRKVINYVLWINEAHFIIVRVLLFICVDSKLLNMYSLMHNFQELQKIVTMNDNLMQNINLIFDIR